MLKTVTLYGELAERYGKNWNLDINSPSEAVRALCANNPTFKDFVGSSQDRGVGYKISVGKTYIEEVNEIYSPSGKQEIKIIPVVLGAKKKGVGTILLGIALIASGGWLASAATQMAASGALGGAAAGAGAAIGPSGLAGLNAASAVGSMVQGIAMKFGAAMILGGIGQLLAPTPTEVKDDENYAFNGAVNTVRQGVPVPICYGQLMIGGAVISSGITNENYSP
jgi:predicted phage tail protein